MAAAELMIEKVSGYKMGVGVGGDIRKNGMDMVVKDMNVTEEGKWD